MQKKLSALLGTALAGAALSTALAATPAHAEQQYTLQNVASGRCLSGQADRTVRQGPCDANAKWMPVYRHSSHMEDAPMLVNVATGMCLDQNTDVAYKEVYLSPCSAEDYGQLMGLYSHGGNRNVVAPVESEMRLTGWNTGSVSFDTILDSRREKQLWATI
ncbi:RICIN domain-containing protein [Streptomyces eurythermus]|uniref:RICIN domain-containing protein n=1 Tax=Streptomyces eurythermus TaxID=42237 RepID=UPI0036F9EB55